MTPAGPTRHELVEADRRARWQAISELRRPLLLEAGAGTGKTTTLVARILAWCLGHGWDRAAAALAARGAEAGDEEVAARVLEGVVAITFTEAAAAEMASRTGRDLALVAAGREDELHGLQAAALPRPLLTGERRARARALLGALDHLQVRTIHAFCLTLLAQHPLEARLHTDLRVDPEGRLVEELTREVLEPRLEALAAGRDGDAVLALARRGIGPREMAGAVADLLSRGLPAGALAHDPLAPAALAELARGLRARLEELLLRAGPLRRLAGQTKPAAVLRAADDTLRALAAWRGDGPAALARLRDELVARWTGDLDGRLRSWARADFNQGERRALGEQRGLLAEAAARLRTPLRHTARLDPELLDVGRRLLQPLAVAVERELRSRGIITFPALLREAQQLLARHPAVCRGLRRRIDQLLVDEFQDTDRLQCEIVRRLALEGPAAERPGLFVVGDPKQSIFGWRDADLEAYQGFAVELLAAGGERHVLSVNYRSRQAILEEVERAVSPVMVARPGLQPPFAPLVAGRATAAGAQAGSPAAGGADDPAPAVEYWVSWQAGPDEPQGGAATPAEEAVRLEARAVATDMRALHQEHGCPWREMALLLRSMSRLEVFLGALRDAGVPFVVTKDKHYYRRREIIEAAALVRAVVDPLDHLALLTWLRSAAVGVPDAALVPLWRGGFPRLASDLRAGDGAALDQLAELAAGVAAELPTGLPGLAELAGWHEVLVVALDALARLRESFRSDPADVFVERLRRLSQLEVVESSRYLGRFRLANLERFFRQLERAIDERGADVSAVLGVLRQRVAQAEEAEEALPKEAAENAVQVLTIHRAKGLEFDHVYLAQLHAQPGARGAGSLDPDERWLPDAPAQYAIFGAATPGFAEVEARRREVAAAEQVRTLYVAMTRARRRLVLAGCWPTAARPRDPAQARCHVDLLLSRRPAAPDLEKMWREAAHGAGWVDALAARWRFPALEHPTAAAAAEPPPASWVPSAERVAADARRLAELEAEAAQRMARRWIAPASEEAAAKLRELALVPGSGLPAARDAALAAGAAVHRALETWDLAAAVTGELERQRRLLPAYLAARLEPDLVPGALARGEEILARLARGTLLPRLRALAPHILGREVAALLPPGEVAGGPLAAVSGAIDLLLRDPADGRLVVVDYKTDLLEDPLEIAHRAAAYGAQGKVYLEAVRDALEPNLPPRFELWFLWADRIVVPEVAGPSGQST